MTHAERIEHNRLEDARFSFGQDSPRVAHAVATAAEATKAFDGRYEVDREEEVF